MKLRVAGGIVEREELKDRDLFLFDLDTYIALFPRSDKKFVEKMKKSSRIIEYDKGNSDRWGDIYFRWLEEEQDGIWPVFHFMSSVKEFISQYYGTTLDDIRDNMILLENLW